MTNSDGDAPGPEVYPLIDSIFGFAPPEVVAELGNRKEADDMMRQMNRLPTSDDPLSETIPWFLRIFEAGLLGSAKGKLARLSAGYYLRQRQQDLIQGRLVGIGYRVAADGRRFREAIPGQQWRDGEITWDKNRLDDGGVAYEQIVVTLPEHISAVMEGMPYARRPSEAAPPGRPSYGRAIEEAYEKIQKDYTRSFAYHIPIIRQEAQDILGTQDMRNLGESAIRKKVGTRFSREKAGMKRVEKG